MRVVVRVLPIAVLLGVVACQSGRHSPAGFRLPDTGDAQRGKQLFVAFGCSTCHEVAGQDLPKPTVQPPVPVVLGGLVTQEVTDGFLVTSIVNPSYHLPPYSKDQVSAGGKSRMPDFADRVTVRQLTDLVTYLQSTYYVRRLPRYPIYGAWVRPR